MKSLKIASLFVLSTFIFTLTSCDKETVMTSSKIPSEINSYVATHFPDNKIIQVVKELDGTTKTYDVILKDNISLEFNRKKEIIQIESKNKLPDSVIPDGILEYVHSNFPDNFILEWELENKKTQQVKLDNGLELEFSKSGDFLRIDD